MSTTIESADSPASEVLLPSPAIGSRCDADRSEAAVARVYTATGPLDLCGHHLRQNSILFAALDYEIAYSDPDLEIDPFPAPSTSWL
jgi:hypothetical protein